MKRKAAVLPGRVLVVAGSDSGGGAGIQADIKTIFALGGFPTTAITALTAQNTRGVGGVLLTPGDFVAAQMGAVLEDIGTDCIKTGLLPDRGVIDAVVGVLEESARGIPLVVDPVMVASSGDSLMADGVRQYLVERLVVRSDLCTPNMPEAALMTGQVVEDMAGMDQAAGRIMAMGAGAVLVKGGHGTGPVIYDLLVSDEGRAVFEGSRLESRNIHGTGCTLASAIATGLAQGFPLVAAIKRAREFVRTAIADGFPLGRGDNRPLSQPRDYS